MDQQRHTFIDVLATLICAALIVGGGWYAAETLRTTSAAAQLEQLKQIYPNAADEQALAEIYWSRYKDVAHVCGAILLLDNNISDEMRVIEDLPGLSAVYYHTPFVLCLARVYQEFGLSYVPHGRREPILPPETLWRLPEVVPHVPEKVIVGPMSEEDLAFLRDRKATSRD